MSITKSTSWQRLKDLYSKNKSIHLLDRFINTANRFDDYSIETDELLFDFSKHQIDKEILGALIEFSKERNFSREREAFFSGEKINKTESRAVLHTALRCKKDEEILVEGENVIPKVHSVLNKIDKFSESVINGDFKGYSGKKITDVVNIGIGGSDLGPKMVVKGLRKYQNHLKMHYVSNIDFAAIEEVLATVDLESTLFVIVSKTFTTIETITNAKTARRAVVDYFGTEDCVANHFVAVSTNTDEVTSFGIARDNIFEFWDWVGGRYSLWSGVGLSISLSVGFDNFKKLLEGARSADLHFKNQPDEANIPLLMALLDLWYNNFYDYRSQAIIPYAEDLSLFPKFLQQLDMESNGKSVDKDGNKVDYKTSNVIWGEAGTDSQHSFFQLLHQGTDIIPVDFIGVKKLDNQHDEILMSNLLAQSKALMEGTVNDDVDESDEFCNHKYFEGNRPSTTIVLKELNPHNLGFLIALYEHKVFTQGVLWNVFSFDQWGVQLGKKLASSINNLDGNEIDSLDSSTKGLYQFFKR